MSDSEDYSSSDDEDYVPSGGEYSEDDVNELEKEDDDEEQEDGEEKVSLKKKNKKKEKNSILARKRKKGVLSLNSEEGQVEKDKDGEAEEEDLGPLDELKKQKLEEAKKKREEDLWSSFLSDVGKPPKSQLTVPVAQNNRAEEKDKDSNKSLKEDSQTKNDCKKLTITKVFDFAGEEVRVTQEVDCSSKEAKAFIKQQEKGLPEQSPAPSRTPTAASSGVKRPVGMSSILGQLGSKKQKISTLEKSKLDWESFKVKEGIGEELARHNRGKDGYIERKAFLERVDYRQFEQEREIRLKNMKP
ncbi:craniofacial development protein 1 isoform X2 [Hyla sarda]|uniref:craniofacial development protein 1 isoform X2 n=1 Tax=Hyla sarda TaxID=327740 RepID=UPI0024C28246|nr:craniofacial development protein 1 isoform X2 [Hyla sarda]